MTVEVINSDTLTLLFPRVELDLTASDFLSVTRMDFNGTGLSLEIFEAGLSLDIFEAGLLLDIFEACLSIDIFEAGFSMVRFGANLPTGGGWLVGIGGSLLMVGLPDSGLKKEKKLSC